MDGSECDHNAVVTERVLIPVASRGLFYVQAVPLVEGSVLT